MSGDEYRALAHECMEAADRTSDPGRKISMLELARRWLRLAQQLHERRTMGDALIDPRCSKPLNPVKQELTSLHTCDREGYAMDRKGRTIASVSSRPRVFGT
jgi:hypothetical protein